MFLENNKAGKHDIYICVIQAEIGIGIGIKIWNETLRRIPKALTTRENTEDADFNVDNLT